jgi:hypothetical protein
LQTLPTLRRCGPLQTINWHFLLGPAALRSHRSPCSYPTVHLTERILQFLLLVWLVCNARQLGLQLIGGTLWFWVSRTKLRSMWFWGWLLQLWFVRYWWGRCLMYGRLLDGQRRERCRSGTLQQIYHLICIKLIVLWCLRRPLWGRLRLRVFQKYGGWFDSWRSDLERDGISPIR